jgi:polyisoprenoid-binding protein YceI
MPVASVTSTPAPAATATRAAVAQPTATVAAGKRTTGQVDGVIFEVSQGSKATFTVGEELVRVPVPIEAVLSTTNLSGEVRLDGQPSSITINLHSLTSDQANRDRYVRTQMFPQHPTATISIGSVTPLPAGFTDGNEVKAQVKGVLSIRGVEAPMTFEVEARDDGDVVFVVARSSFTWADIGMGAPRAQSVVSVDDTVRVEVLLALRPAGA